MKNALIDKNLFFSFFFFCFAVFAAFVGWIDFALIMLIIACAFELFFVKRQPLGYSSLTFVFIFFSMIYGLAGPITQCWLGGIDDIFGSSFDVAQYIVAFSLSEVGLIIGYMIFLSRHDVSNIVDDRKKIIDNRSARIFGLLAPILIMLGLVFQLINIVRAGGFDMIFASKAVYQAAESALSFTLPAQIVVELGIASLAFYVGICRCLNIKIERRIVIFAILPFIPYLFIISLLGQRGKILYFVVILFLGITAFSPVKRIKKKSIFLMILMYIFIVFIYTNRGIVPLFMTNNEEFFSRVTNVERYVNNLNPGDTEFSCAFGNFNKLIVSDDYDFKYGETYVKGLALLVPSFLYPGEKPQQITYEFRDKYFASEAKRSVIAGTAFSSILESYWNFGYIGILISYILYGCIISYLDFAFSKRSALKMLFIIVITGSMVTFSRSQLGDICSNIFYIGIFLILFIALPYSRSIKKNRGAYDK